MLWFYHQILKEHCPPVHTSHQDIIKQLKKHQTKVISKVHFIFTYRVGEKSEGLVIASRVPCCLSSDTFPWHRKQEEESDKSQICHHNAEEHTKHIFCSWLFWGTGTGSCTAGQIKSLQALPDSAALQTAHSNITTDLKACWLPRTSGGIS